MSRVARAEFCAERDAGTASALSWSKHVSVLRRLAAFAEVMGGTTKGMKLLFDGPMVLNFITWLHECR